ncbi:MAG: Crp/Fnr family transcriptional regulator [Gammaproteobacteria bacterium]|nr:Crp/Fnr family transcriptional regulator [Gammaproteobacteria bacterium]MBQ0839548.1 Crp/Fnr family transcriptional regulator [Gammaproteobacteria bacterium]
MKIEVINEVWGELSKCELCGIRDLVLFADLKEEDFRLIHQPIVDLHFKPLQSLYRSDDSPDFVYTIRSGLVKLVNYSSDGRYRIVRLLGKGDLVGIEVLSGQPYAHSAEALEPLAVCRIPVSEVLRINQDSPRLHEQMLARWQKISSDADYWITELSTGQARQRVIHLLLHLASLSDRDDFFLPSREDMGAMLAITTETASRMISALRSEGVLQVQDKSRASANLEQLRALLT